MESFLGSPYFGNLPNRAQINPETQLSSVACLLSHVVDMSSCPNLCKDSGRAPSGEMKVGIDLLLTFMQDKKIGYEYKHMLKKICHGGAAMICEKV